MADSKISALTAATSALGADEFAVNEAGTSKKVTATQLKTFIAPSGTALLDFGAFPGSSDTSIAITGQANIVASSIAHAWLIPVATTDHTADEHIVETIEVYAGNIVAGTGFTIYGVNINQINEPIVAGIGGKGTRIFGKWTVAWTWI